MHFKVARSAVPPPRAVVGVRLFLQNIRFKKRWRLFGAFYTIKPITKIPFRNGAIDTDTSNILKYDVDRIVVTVKYDPDEYELQDIYDRFKKSRPDLDIRDLDVSKPNDFLDVMKNQTIQSAFEEYINPINYRGFKIRIEKMKLEEKKATNPVQVTQQGSTQVQSSIRSRISRKK